MLILEINKLKFHFKKLEKVEQSNQSMYKERNTKKHKSTK